MIRRLHGQDAGSGRRAIRALWADFVSREISTKVCVPGII
jgi:hypothetical protein